MRTWATAIAASVLFSLAPSLLGQEAETALQRRDQLIGERSRLESRLVEIEAELQELHGPIALELGRAQATEGVRVEQVGALLSQPSVMGERLTTFEELWVLDAVGESWFKARAPNGMMGYAFITQLDADDGVRRYLRALDREASKHVKAERADEAAAREAERAESERAKAEERAAIEDERCRAAEEKWGARVGEEVCKRRVVLGMDMEQVLASWGTPIDINRTTVQAGSFSQWVYSGDRYVYFENGVLTAIQD